jgi:hypothetical protein
MAMRQRLKKEAQVSNMQKPQQQTSEGAFTFRPFTIVFQHIYFLFYLVFTTISELKMGSLVSQTFFIPKPKFTEKHLPDQTGMAPYLAR